MFNKNDLQNRTKNVLATKQLETLKKYEEDKQRETEERRKELEWAKTYWPGKIKTEIGLAVQDGKMYCTLKFTGDPEIQDLILPCIRDLKYSIDYLFENEWDESGSYDAGPQPTGKKVCQYYLTISWE